MRGGTSSPFCSTTPSRARTSRSNGSFGSSSVFDRDGHEGQRHAPGDEPAEDLRHPEAEDDAEDGAAGDELRRVGAGQHFRVEVGAQMAIQLVDAIAHSIACAQDGPLDVLLLIRLGHQRLLTRATSALSASRSSRMCSIESLGTKLTLSSFFLPINASTPATANKTTVTISADSHAGTPSATRPSVMVTNRKAMPISARNSAADISAAPPLSFAADSFSSSFKSATSFRKRFEK